MSRKILALDIRHEGVSALLVQNTFKGNRIEWFRHVRFEDQDTAVEGPQNALGRAI